MTVEPPAFSSRPFVGASVMFDGPHLALRTVLQLPRPQWPRLLAESIDTAEKLGGAVAGGDILKRVAAAARSVSAAAEPWSPWLHAFGRLHGVPEWRQQAETGDDGSITLRVACPYIKALDRWAGLALRLLRLAERALQDGRVEANAGAWEKALAVIGADLPDAPLMRLHAALTKAGLPWEWQGGDSTAVGQGSRKTLLRGVPIDVDLEVQRLAAMDLHIPVYTITGSFGKTTTARLLAQLLEPSGLRLGLQASDGAWAAGTQIYEGDCIDGRAAKAIMRRSDVDAAVLEFGRGGLIDRGFPFEKVDVGVLLNILDFHIGTDGIDTLEQMADVKALTLKPARVAVLNHNDAQCRRIARRLDAAACVWFSTTSPEDELRHLSTVSKGALGVLRDPDGSPLALAIWQGGNREKSLALEGVAPYQGMLGEKTLEELLAAVAAAWFGPIRLDRLEALLPRLRLDSANHRFRTSSHCKGNLLFVLDKAAERTSLRILRQSLDAIGERHGVARRIAVITRSPGELPERNLHTCAMLHPQFDEFIFFDRPESYAGAKALPIYEQGSVPLMLGAELERLNRLSGEEKSVRIAGSWDEAEAYLRTRLASLDEMTLVLINQPTSVAAALNARIISFVDEMTAAEA